MSTVRRVHYTYAEYLALEKFSSVRHEYLDGEIYAIAGGSPDHAALAAALIQVIGRQLLPGWRTFTSDLRVRISATGLTTYPDAAVICGPTERAADDALTVTNPLVLVEVTSQSTEEYDRNEKLRNFQSLPSLREVLIASHREPHLTLHRREEAGWITLTAERGGALTLSSVAVRVEVDEICRDGLED
jgi:Uma2 family endonuclease